MSSPALHRFALLVASLCVALVAHGALSLAGKGGLPPDSHGLMGSSLLLLSILQAVWAMRTEQRAAVTFSGWLLAALLALSAAPLPSAFHAGVTQTAVAAAMAFAAIVSPAWIRGPRPVADEGTPSARTFGWLAPALVLIQIVLGAGFRHGWLPLWPHLTGSLLVGSILLYAGMAVMQSYSLHDALRKASAGLLWVTGVQVTLGMAAYGVRVMTDPAAWTGYLTAAHVAAGAVTLGVATVFGLQVFYHVRESLLVSGEAAA